MKFGGTSVGSAERIRNACAIIKNNSGKKPVVVVSAVAKITDMLIRLADESSQGRGNDLLEDIRNVHLGIMWNSHKRVDRSPDLEFPWPRSIVSRSLEDDAVLKSIGECL